MRSSGDPIRLHLSTQLVELRQPQGNAAGPLHDGRAHEEIRLPSGGRVTLLAPHRGADRLSQAALDLPLSLDDSLYRHGKLIRYDYVTQDWPLDAYQTMSAVEPGSAEMPSAGRPFAPHLETRVIRHDWIVAPILLHTGVASLEEHEPPYEEYFRVSPTAAQVVTAARPAGGRMIAVGTTVVRTLETVSDPASPVYGGEGWTDLVITSDCRLRAVDGLLTGFHEPRASHFAVLSALTRGRHLERAYREALRKRDLWHEFSDLHLILP